MYCTLIGATNLDEPKQISTVCFCKGNSKKISCFDGDISSIRTPGNHRLYNLNGIESLFQDKENGGKRKICYARVSSDHQKEDLERQVEDLRRKYPNHEIVRDIGSGLNWHRKGFEKMMKDVMNEKVEEIVCTHKLSMR